jgi:ABC-2 type transport system permease protein
MGFARDTRIVFDREFAPVPRQPVSLAFAMIQPLLFLLLFGSLLAGSGTGEGGAGAWQWFVPGVLLMMCLFGPMQAGYSLLMEAIGGSLERLLVTPLNRAALLTGRVLKEFVILLVQAALLVVVAIPMGFRPHLAGVFAGLALLVVLGVGLGSLSFVLAIASKPSGTIFYLVTQTVLFPLVLLSGVLLPLSSAPAWMRAAAAVNPLRYVVDAERALFAGRFGAAAVPYGLVAAAVLAAVGLLAGVRAMRRAV